MQVEHELYQRPLQLRAPVRVEHKPAAREIDRAREIHQPQTLAQLHVRLRLEGERRLLAVKPHHRVILRALPDRHRLVGQIRQPQHQLIPRRFRFRRLLVQRRDAVAQVAGLLLLSLCLRDLLLAHQRADLFRHALALGLKRFDLAQQLAPLLVQLQQFVNAGLIPCPARRQALAHKIRPFTNQFDVEHRRIIGATSSAASE